MAVFLKNRFEICLHFNAESSSKHRKSKPVSGYVLMSTHKGEISCGAITSQ